MRNKARFEFVDELRKINTIEKMGVIDSFYPQDFEDHKQENNKFIRYKELVMQEEAYQDDQLFINPIINNYKQDDEDNCRLQFSQNTQGVTKDINYYHDWSQYLNQQIKEKSYSHRFYFKHAQPPPRNKEETGKQKGKKEQDATRSQDPAKQGQINEEQDTNIDLPHRGKYNFHEITKNLYNRQFDKEEKENKYLRDLAVKNEITQYRKLKSLQDIENIGDFAEEFNKFNYYIENPHEDYNIDFIDNSVVLTKNKFKIDYFRQIGQPSRNLMNYTMRNSTKMQRRDDEDSMDISNLYDQQKRELLYLYFLKDEELKINKNDMNFSDIANISMGRITPNNAQMCVRNQKVTKAQYLKLVKKMEKYDIRDNQGGRPKADYGMCTQEFEDLNIPVRDKGEDSDNSLAELNVEEVIQSINLVKKQVKMFEHPSCKNSFHTPNFNQEVYKKLQRLLNILYESIIDKNKRLPLSEIRKHIGQVEGTNSLGYDKLRLLWYVANTYQEVFNKSRKKADFRDLVFMKGPEQPKITRYVKNKAVAQEHIQTKKIYGFHAKNTQRSKSPLASKTPLKTPRRKENEKTPTKNNTTAKKRNVSALANRTTTAKK